MNDSKLFTLFFYLSVGIVLLSGLEAQDQDGYEEEFNTISERSFDNGNEETNNYDLSDEREKINMKRNSDSSSEAITEAQPDEDCEIPAETAIAKTTTKKTGFFSNLFGNKKNKDEKKNAEGKKKNGDKKTNKKPKVKTTTVEPSE